MVGCRKRVILPTLGGCISKMKGAWRLPFAAIGQQTLPQSDQMITSEAISYDVGSCIAAILDL